MTRHDIRRGATTGLDHVGLYLATAGRFADAVAQADLRAPVASCPGWSTYDLVCHLGNIHAWAATIVETGAAAAEQNDEPHSRRPRVVSEWYAGKAEDLHQVLRAADPDAPCWNFAFGDGPARFWGRRQLHETTVHLVDLMGAREPDLDPEVCADGVDEVLRVFLPRMHQRGHPAELTASLCVVATDTGRAWTVTPRVARADGSVPLQARSTHEGAAPLADGPPLVVDRRLPSADRVEAPAPVLYRMLWKRLPADHADIGVSGAADRVHAFLSSRLVP